MFDACFEQQLPLYMPASTPTVDRRSIPAVAIIGNDAVLVAAPATPVQLSHACLRRGFSVAVPASWGDELIAAEAMRKLASRDKGPAVMCVCPYARSRLLTPGPDLEPFLVSLVAPPLATARYLRAVYGERGVHITYIGSCPSANDSAIDERLTPDAFLADLAERGIALSEQPLVFDSIVPPDRRRWCSLAGGVPSGEMPGSDADTRTLIEIERDDVSTDLAQHIIARENVLLDLAPGLGCACSGAIGPLRPRGARAAVTALEPPRALGPIVDLTVVVALDAPLSAPLIAPTASSPAVSRETHTDLLERQLDEMLGVEASHPEMKRALDAEFEAELDADLAEVFLAAGRPAEAPHHQESLASESELPLEPSVVPGSGDPRGGIGTTAFSPTEHVSDAAVADRDVESRDIVGSHVEAPRHHVRRRTPPSTPSRYAGNSVPTATGTDGRPLPRAYVAKRRTPSVGIPTIDESPPPVTDTAPSPDEQAAVGPPPFEDMASLAAADAITGEVPASTGSPRAESEEVAATVSDIADSSAAAAVNPPSAESGERTESGGAPRVEPPAGPQVSSSGAAAAAALPNQDILRMLTFAVLLAFAAVVLYTLQP